LAENAKKGIVTRGGHAIIFDDVDKILSINTAEKYKIILDGKNKKIEVSDENDNIITMNKEGITIKSKEAINLEAAGNKLVMDKNGVLVKSSAKMNLEASAAIEIKGATIDLK
jgi:hypothetical protein